MTLLHIVVLVILGLSGGIAVGSGLVAFITVLDIIPRLAQLTRSRKLVTSYQWSLIAGTLAFTFIDFYLPPFHLPRILSSVIGAFAGIFVGMLAAGLTEVLNVFPILAKRLQMEDSIMILLMAMVLGKVVGSLAQIFLGL
jgi:stage V sporulation protein AB